MAALDFCCLYVVTLSHQVLSTYRSVLLLLPPENGFRRWLTLKHFWFHSQFHTRTPGFTYADGLSNIKDSWVQAVCPGFLVEDRIPSVEFSSCLLVWEPCADFCMCLSVLLWAWCSFVCPLHLLCELSGFTHSPLPSGWHVKLCFAVC